MVLELVFVEVVNGAGVMLIDVSPQNVRQYLFTAPMSTLMAIGTYP